MIEIIRIRYDILNGSHVMRRVNLPRKERVFNTPADVEYFRKKIEMKAQYKVERGYTGDPDHIPRVSVLIDTRIKESYYNELLDKDHVKM